MPSPIAQLRHKLSWHLYSPSHTLARRRVGARPFTIITNNCWGAEAYTELGRGYTTPFVGLFLQPDCYLTMLHDLRGTLASEPNFKAESKYAELEASRRSGAGKHGRRADGSVSLYPIAQLGDSEIHFLHYASEAEARDKWTRRLARMEWDHLRFKFCDNQRPTEAQLAAFDGLPLEHKAMFVARPSPQWRCAIWPDTSAAATVPDGLTLYRRCKAYFNIADWLCGGTGRASALQRWMTRGWVTDFSPSAGAHDDHAATSAVTAGGAS